MTRFSRLFVNASAFAFVLCVWTLLLAASAPAKAQGVSGLNLRMVDFAENAFVLVAPGQWQEVDKRNWQRGSVFREIQRNADEVHIRDDSRNIGFAFRPMQMQSWIVLDGQQYQPYGNILNVSSQARIPGSDIAWDTADAPQQAAQPQQPASDPRLARHKMLEDQIRAQYSDIAWLNGQYDASQRKLNFAPANFARGFEITAPNEYQLGAIRINVTPTAYTGSDGNQYILLDFDGTSVDAASVPDAQSANEERDRGWFIESLSINVTPTVTSASVYYEGEYAYDHQNGSMFSHLQPKGTLAHIKPAVSAKPLRSYQVGTGGDQFSRYASYKLVDVIDIDNPYKLLNYTGIMSLLVNPKAANDVVRGLEGVGGIVTGRLYTTSRLHKLPAQAFNGLMPVYQVVYVTNEHYMPIGFRAWINVTLQRFTVKGTNMATEHYDTNQSRQFSFSQNFVVDLGAMQ
ncbi:MAG: hypothetical protein KDE63_09650 [Novosphingobium sp.]|nr:hypothetical protein [Novosphingobium sp.]